MAQKLEVKESNITEGKQLINVGEHRRAWVKSVADLSDGSINEVMRCLIDLASVEDPESYALRVKKYRAKIRLADIERRRNALQQEEDQLVRELEGRITAERG